LLPVYIYFLYYAVLGCNMKSFYWRETEGYQSSSVEEMKSVRAKINQKAS
jgi:hypothetical protein